MTYPVELKVAGRRVLVVGGGSIAAWRAKSLVVAGARVRVVSLEFVPELQQLQGAERVVAAYSSEMICWAQLVFACTDDRQVSTRIAEDAQAAGVLCNAADDPDACDFLMPAILRRGALTVAVGTDGASPMLAARLRDSLESQFSPDLGILVEELRRARDRLRDQERNSEARRKILTALAAPESIERWHRSPQAWRDWSEQLLADARSGGLPLIAGDSTGEQND